VTNWVNILPFLGKAQSYPSRMPQTSWTSSPIYQFLFLLIFILAFFPTAFQFLVKLPFHPFTFPHSKPPTAPTAPPCPPPHCIPREKMPTAWFQKSFTLPSRSRGSYLITSEVVSALPEISSYQVGLLNLFVQHTSCALSMNENWDEDVREDLSDALDRIAPEDRKGTLYRHAAEGVDDMPVRKNHSTGRLRCAVCVCACALLCRFVFCSLEARLLWTPPALSLSLSLSLLHLSPHSHRRAIAGHASLLPFFPAFPFIPTWPPPQRPLTPSPPPPQHQHVNPQLMRCPGTHQSLPNRLERHHTDQQRQVGHGHLAGDLVSGVPG